MRELLKEIRTCVVCREFLPNEPKPVLQAGAGSRILIIGQAPGQKVQDSGIPWQDQSGDELRRWLGVNKEQFYNEELFGLLPMGFCYPGKGRSGDLPPRPECAPAWHQKLFDQMEAAEFAFLIGQYAQKYYLGKRRKSNLTATVRAFREYLPSYFPLVHPSPRNRIWQKKNPWFVKDVVPAVQEHVRRYIVPAM